MEEIEAILATKDPTVHTIAPDALVIDAVERMCAARVGALLVMEGMALLGIFSERDLMTRVLAVGKGLDLPDLIEGTQYGTAWSKKDAPLVPKGATAFGVRLLDQLVESHYEGR